MQTNKGLDVNVNINMSGKGTQRPVEVSDCKGTHIPVWKAQELEKFEDSKLFVVWIYPTT